MPPWLATGMIVATVAVVCALYSFWNGPTPESGHGHCNNPGCSAHNRRSGSSNQNNDWRNNHTGPSSSYDTPPDFRRRCTTEDECPICLENLYSAAQHTLKCRHRLHAECFRRLRTQSQTCPICRRPL